MSPAAGARRGRPGHDQDAVLRTAVDLFNRQGYEGTSMGDIAAELGLVKSALYHHVPGKEHLLAAALDEALDELTASVDRTAPPDGRRSASQRLRDTVHDSVLVLVEHLPAVTLLLRVRGNSAVEQTALQRRRELDDRLADLVREAVAEGSVRDDLPADLTSRLLFGTVNSLVEWYRPGGPVDPEALAEAVTSVALTGLTAAPGR